jgi:hypothetical protein
MSLAPKTFRFALDGGVGTITFDRPERLNSLTFDSYVELGEFFVAVEKHPEVRALVITGAGRGFCSGGDRYDIIARLFERDMQGLVDFTRITGALIRNIRRVRSVEKERDEARSQVQNLRKERLLERLFSEAEGRVGGDERGTFFDTFVTLCGGHFQLGELEGRERLLPVDGKGQPLTADGVALCDGDYMEELRRHPVYSFLFQQRSGLYAGTVAEAGHDHSAAPNLQTLSTAELYLEAVKATTPRAPAPRR